MTACEAAGQTRLSYGKPARMNSFAKTIQTSRTNFFKGWREYKVRLILNFFTLTQGKTNQN